MTKLAARELNIERLDVKESLATEMFADNPYKKQQIPDIASSSENSNITVYRVGNHIDISCGPMVANTRFLGRCTISAVHEVGKEDKLGIYRVQGVALPAGTILNHFAYGVLEDRSRKLVSFCELFLKKCPNFSISRTQPDYPRNHLKSKLC